MIIYVAIMLGGRPPVQSKCLLGLFSIINVLFSLGIAFGISGYLNIVFTPMSQLVIFVLMGIGIDDMFIIGSFNQNPWKKEKEKKKRKM